MSSPIAHGNKTPGLRLALVTLASWLVALAVMWFTLGVEQGGTFLNFVARFHVLLVHFPIGILFLVALLEVLSLRKSERGDAIQRVIPTILWVTVWGTVIATLLGYLLMTVEDFQGWAMTLHLWTGLAVGVFAILSLIFKLTRKSGLYAVSLIAGVVSIGAAGHYGGAMVHEETYLTEFAPEPLKPLLLAGLKPAEKSAEPHKLSVTVDETSGETTVEETEDSIPLEEFIVFSDFVLPVLEAKCTECHNPNKIKGKLRMDTHEMLMAGAEGSDYETVIPGNPDESEMLVRVNLPPDDDEFMPTKGEPLTPEETALIAWWVKAGASADATVGSLSPSDEDKQLLVAVAAGLEGEEEVAPADLAAVVSEWDTFTEEERAQRMQKATDAAASYNFSLMPISAEDDRLRINVVNAAKDFGDDALKELEPVAERLVWLDLARSQVSDEGLKTIGKFYNLERLHLENTKVTDAGIAQLGNLQNLEYLNLYGTEVTNQIFETFARLPNLKKLYLWQTQVEPDAARTFERSVNLEINTGYDLAAAVETAPAEEAKPDAPKPAEPAKPAPAPEKKPEAKKADTPPAKPAASAPKAEPKKADTPPVKPAASAPKAEPKKADTPPVKPAASAPKAAPKKVEAPKPAATPEPKKGNPSPDKGTPAPAPKPKPAEAANASPAPQVEKATPAPAAN